MSTKSHKIGSTATGNSTFQAVISTSVETESSFTRRLWNHNDGKVSGSALSEHALYQCSMPACSPSIRWPWPSGSDCATTRADHSIPSVPADSPPSQCGSQHTAQNKGWYVCQYADMTVHSRVCVFNRICAWKILLARIPKVIFVFEVDDTANASVCVHVCKCGWVCVWVGGGVCVCVCVCVC